MKNARIIAVLVLLALSLSDCANADRSEVSAPSLQETVTTESEQSTMQRHQSCGCHFRHLLNLEFASLYKEIVVAL